MEGSARVDIAGPTPGNWYMLAALDKSPPLPGKKLKHDWLSLRKQVCDWTSQFLDCSVRVVGRVEYWIQKDIITIMPVFQDYQDIMTFNTITGLQTYKYVIIIKIAIFRNYQDIKIFQTYTYRNSNSFLPS